MKLLNFKKKFKDTLALYDDLYFTRMVKNDSLACRSLDVAPNKLGVDFIGTYEGSNLTFYYLIEGLPKQLMLDFKTRIRRNCRQGVRVNFYTQLRGHIIDWESPQMISRLRILRQAGEENDSADVNSYNRHQNVGTRDKQKWIEESLDYLATADKGRDRGLMKASMMLTISGVRGEDFDDSVKAIEQYTRNVGIRMNRVLYNIPEILRYFSPFHQTASKNIDKFVTTMVLTDEVASRFTGYTQGTLGTRGIYFGTDVYSNFPVLKQVKQNDDSAENWLITAETGGGKSFTVKDIILQLLSINFNGTIMDIEGFEYIPLANFISHNSKVQIINMAEGTGKYFDPVEIAKLTGIWEIDKESKNMSVNFTLATYKTLLGTSYAKDEWLDVVINDAVSETYRQAEITEDPTTWENSVGLTLHDVYAMMFVLKQDKFRENSDYLVALEKAIALTGRYFEEDGTRSHIFKERVLITDIIDANLVVCSFGMAGKSPQSVDQIQLALMQLSAAQLSHQRSIFSKAKGKFNFKLWEEFQRWGNFPDSEKTIGVALTGGRKLGDVNIIITNDVGQILKDDRFSIFSNITSFLIGAINDAKIRKELSDRLSIPHMLKELNKISEAARLTDEEDEDAESKQVDSPLTYAFLCGLDRSKFGIVKVMLPEDIAKSKILKTGVDLEGAVK